MNNDRKTRNSLRAQARRAATRGRQPESGIALPIALLLLVLLLGMGVVMVVAVSSDLFINSFYRNNRGAYYGADSGLNIVRRDVENRLMALAPASFAAGTAPIAPGSEAGVRSAVLSTYGANSYINDPAVPGSSHPTQFRLENLQLALISNPVQPVVTSTGPGGVPTGYSYTYNYTIQTVGRSQGAEEIRLNESGTLTLNAAVSPSAPQTVSFANWGFFVDNQTVCSGSFLVPGTVTGPVHTNGGWTFGTTGAYVFTDQVSQSGGNMGFQFSGGSGCTQSPTAPVSKSGQTINPNFQAGMNVNNPLVPLPQNDFSQKRAVLDSMGTNTAPVTMAEMNAELKRINGTAYPSSGAPPASGVYVPYAVDPVTGQSVVSGGGIHVAGNAAVTLSTVGATGQRFTIVQGGVTTTITVDTATNTTVITSGATTRTLQGVFMDYAGSPNRPATMLYVDGSITNLKGPAQGVPAIQDGAAVTITAASNITVTGDLLYKTPPVTKTANDPCCPGSPAGTLIPGNDMGQVFGIYTATGDIQLNNGQANGMLEIDASMATLSQGGTGGLTNIGAKINTLNIIGGRIQNNIKNINSTTRNVLYDRRFATGFGPPWFPSTTINPPALSTATYTSSAQRVRWFNVTQQ